MVRENFLKDILADPITGEKLMQSPDGFVNKDGKTYPMHDNIPDFVSHQQYVAPQSDLHKKEGTHFHYREHYTADASFFNYTEGDDNSVTKQERRRNRETIVNTVDKKASMILDIGCGDGWVAKYFTTKTKVVSMDLALTNPKKALLHYPSENHAAVVADGMNLPFADEVFDTIIASEVIEHLADPITFVKGCMQKLKANGKLILVTPYNEKLRFHICVHCNNPTTESAHLHSFHEKNIERITGKWTYATVAFNNTYALKMRLYNLLSFIPFKFWKITDNIANAFFKKPLTFLIVLTK